VILGIDLVSPPCHQIAVALALGGSLARWIERRGLLAGRMERAPRLSPSRGRLRVRFDLF
jgi:hypothetical protein